VYEAQIEIAPNKALVEEKGELAELGGNIYGDRSIARLEASKQNYSLMPGIWRAVIEQTDVADGALSLLALGGEEPIRTIDALLALDHLVTGSFGNLSFRIDDTDLIELGARWNNFSDKQFSFRVYPAKLELSGAIITKQCRAKIHIGFDDRVVQITDVNFIGSISQTEFWSFGGADPSVEMPSSWEDVDGV
jgi:hypothetical protein